MGIDSKTTFDPPKERVFTNTASVSALIDPKDDPITESARKEKELVERDLNRARGGIDLSQRTGRMNRGQSVIAETINLEDQKKKDEKTMRTAMSQAQKAMEERLAELAKELDKVNKVLGAFDKLEDLIKDGKFDKDSAAHLLLLQQTGMTLEEVEGPGALEKTKEKRQPFEEYKKGIEEEVEYLESSGAKIMAAVDNHEIPADEGAAQIDDMLNHASSAGVHNLWRNDGVHEEVKVAAAKNFSSGFGTSITKTLEGVPEGIQSSEGLGSLSAMFAEKADPLQSTKTQPEMIAYIGTKFTMG